MLVFLSNIIYANPNTLLEALNAVLICCVAISYYKKRKILYYVVISFCYFLTGGGAAGGGEKETTDMWREVLLETNPWLLGTVPGFTSVY